MADKHDEDRRKGDRRKEETPRRGARRTGEDRRKQEDAPQPEGPIRSGKERRAHVRRAGRRRRRWDRRIGDRREKSPELYSRDELAQIRKLIVSPKLPFECPRCEGILTMGDPIAGNGFTIRTVRCSECHRSSTFPDYIVARALVIEEDDRVREALRTILASAGHEVQGFRDGAAGLASYRESPADVVLVDISSPRAEVEFIGKCRKEFPDVRLIAVAGKRVHGAGDPLAVAGKLGALATLRKPFTPHEVLRTLDDALQLVRPD
jgi:CheY-like chemotaxis protein